MTRRKTVPLVVHKVDTVTLKLQLKIPLTMDLSVLAVRESIKSMQGIWCRIGEKETQQLLDAIASVYCQGLPPLEPSGKVFFRFEEDK